MKTSFIKTNVALIVGFALLTMAYPGQAQTTIWSDNFNIADTSNLDNSDNSTASGRHT